MAADNRKIAKNTMMLYIRMLLIMAVTLYTSRVILKVLGIEDYGIYNLIAGFVTFLVFITNSLVSAMQRYFNVALGQNDSEKYKEVFSMSLNILFLFSILIFIVGETLGLWFVNNHLNIPSERSSAAMWVYQISLITLVANTLRTPFHASIIAHEKMSFYAYISIVEVLSRLGLVFLLTIIPFDSLIMYALLYMSVVIGIDLFYILYCAHEFTECRYYYKKDRRMFKELLGFSGWTLLGQSSVVVKNQGEAILINIFFGVAVNAAMGIAAQVANALEMFVSNFQTAFNPQLVQSFASKDFNVHRQLLFRASKFSYFLLLILLVPIVSNIEFVLDIWLTDIPEYTNLFIKYILISYLLNAISTPFATSIFASGHIKNYQMLLSAIFMLGVVAIYVLLYFGGKPYYVSVVAIFIQLFLAIIRLYFSHKYVGFSYKNFIKNVLIPVSAVTVLSLVLPCLISRFAITPLLSVALIMMEAFYVGLLVILLGVSNSERMYIVKTFKNKL